VFARGDTATPSGLYARLCHEFLVGEHSIAIITLFGKLLQPKVHKKRLPRPAWRVYNAPLDPLAGFKESLRGGEGQGRDKMGKRGAARICH